ncbi:MAG: phosphomannomutase/phosphoglucomutase [Candidatus Diapherotrites archaeon]|nr:phosphomannomutase/phosphoglucomutase [Candidatus Diapherotrites archaeon]
MSLTHEIFREYDIRGLVDRELSPRTMGLLGKGIGTFFRKTGGEKIAVGHDNRKTSPAYAQALARGLVSTGCHVTLVGLATTPMVYFETCKGNYDGCAIVTASHNPPEFNGLKLASKKTAPVFGEQLQQIRKIIEKKEFLAGKGSLCAKTVADSYAAMLSGKIRLPKKIKVVVDTGNGVAGMIAPGVLRSWGLEVVELFTGLDGSFPNHLPDPTEEKNMRALSRKVVEEKADLGLGFDGDADRLGVVTSNGELVFADKILCVLALDFLKKHPGGKILADVKCSRLVQDIAEKNGGEVVWWKTGHSLIKSKMREEKILLAGEMSGHMFFADEFYGFDDALYAAGRLLGAIQDGKGLCRVLESFPVYFNTPEIRLDCPEEKKGAIVEKVKKHFLEKFPSSVTIDGIRVVFPHGWGLVRKSNTQAKLILRFEADSGKELEKIRAEVNGFLQPLLAPES